MNININTLHKGDDDDDNNNNNNNNNRVPFFLFLLGDTDYPWVVTMANPSSLKK
jgi:hypothetical protein